jgi:AraC-like DNA-binding protein
MKHCTTIYRVFKKKFDCTPREYIAARRMERAAELLRKTGLPIQVIARRLQYSNPFYFSKCFKEHFNISPRAFRDSDGISPIMRLRREPSSKQEIHGKKHWFYMPDSKEE